MTEIILYPTETVYALGVNVLDEAAWRALCELKRRSDAQPASWLVRNQADIETYAEVSEVAERLIAQFMPGPITLVLPAKNTVPNWAQSESEMVSFRMSPDKTAQALIEAFMAEHNTPLTCTSANVHKLPTQPAVSAILEQFGPDAKKITQCIDDGPRVGEASTVVAVVDSQLHILRPGPILASELEAALG